MGTPNDSGSPSDVRGKMGLPRGSEVPRKNPQRVRVVAATDGRHWIVSEVPPPQGDAAESGSLIFVSNHAMRRVRDYPSDWYEWSDADLVAVSLRR